MESLETELDRARDLDVAELADAIETIGFECTRCGACCKAETGCGGADGTAADDDGSKSADPHTATVFPDEIRRLQASDGTDYDFRDVARPMPYGLTEGPDGPEGETFEWALQTDGCGDCTFYEETGGTGACTVHEDRPLICRTYPFSVALGGTTQPMGEVVDSVAPEGDGEADEPDDGSGMVRAHECEGLGRDISRADAKELAAALKERAVRELEEAIGVREQYQPVETAPGEVVVHDSEGQKRPDGTPRE
ncbi:YkgJ family cysteine cluster protein [Haloarcula pelagica]|uniref:YkgJ family cysteine cluster protein n=1 Tax=Haloarcula pelagica TaxID=3033389 RepID=UPI0024C3EA80|nr:YkgJ family cysteine cluster protein [Halomicroarcula sp. YJ-61-S]